MSRRLVMLTTHLARGGAETQIVTLALSLRRGGWKVSVVSLRPPSAYREELEAVGVPVFSLDMHPGGWNLAGAARLVAILRQLRPHILHSHLFHANLLARAIRPIWAAPVVINTVHSMAESSRDSDGVLARDWLYRITDKLSDTTVCVCQASAERHAASNAISRRRLRVIPNGVDTDRFRPDAAERARLREALGMDSGFAWLAAGRLMWKKDFRTMLEAMARQRAGTLYLAGTGPQERELHALARDLGASVRFLGPRDDMSALMNACDGLLLSSVVEGLPMVLLEAAASGLPCVATDVGGVREIVLDQRTGFVTPPGDADAFADAMSRLAALSTEARRRMGQTAREHALARFDARLVAARWEHLYDELLTAARRGSLMPEGDG